MTLKLKMEVEIPRDVLNDIMETAFCLEFGGCWHWAEPAMWSYEDEDWLKTETPHAITSHWLEARIKDKEAELADRTYWVVSWETLRKGMQHILDSDYSHAEAYRKLQGYIRDAVIDGDTSMLDAYAVDSIVQIGLFGEEVYG